MRLWLLLLLLSGLTLPLSAETPLYWAIANNDAYQVWTLTSQDPPPEMLSETGDSTPAWAVERGSAEALDILAWRGVKLDGIDDKGRNLLFGAAALGRVDLFEKIRAAGARADVVDQAGRNLVHSAAGSPHPEMLRAVLALGLDAAQRSTTGITPLMVACLMGQPTEVAVLLNWGAVPEDEDYLGRSVRDYALAGGSPAILDLVDGALTPWTIAADDGVPLP